MIDSGDGKFEPREVKTGRQSEQQTEIIKGVAEGEKVVVSANFLIDAESNLQAALLGMTGLGMTGNTPGTTANVLDTQLAAPAGKTYQGIGTLDAIDNSTITITHGAIATLGWPAMTMNFNLANPDLIKAIRVGDQIEFSFSERAPDVWELVTVTKARAAETTHKGH